MSLRQIYNINQNEFAVPSLDVNNFQINNADVIPSQIDGGISSVTSSDNSCVVTVTNGVADITNTSRNWASVPANAEVVMNEGQISGLANFTFAPFAQSTPLTLYQSYTNDPNVNPTLCVTEDYGSTTYGQIYDTYYNKPALSDVLSLSAPNTAAGASITDVGSLNCTSLTVNGNPITGNSGGPTTSTTTLTLTGDDTSNPVVVPTLTFNSNSDNYATIQYNNNAGTWNFLLKGSESDPLVEVMQIQGSGDVTLSHSGVVNVTDGTNIGRVYDDRFHLPPVVPSPVNKTVYQYSGYFINGSSSLLIGGNITSTQILGFTVPSGCNLITMNYQIIVQSVDINLQNGQPAPTPPFHKAYALYIGDTANIGALNTNLQTTQALDIITYNGGFDVYVLKGTLICSIINGASFPQLSVYAYDGSSLFASSQVSSVSTSWGSNSTLSGTVVCEQLPSANIELVVNPS